MSNPATLAAPFTKENAREMALRSHAARKLNRERDEILRANAAPAPDDARKSQTLKQLDALDLLINDALNKGHESRFLKLTTAKERLWRLVQPSMGAIKPPRGSFPRPAPPVAVPLADTRGWREVPMP